MTTTGAMTLRSVGAPVTALAAGPLNSLWYAQGSSVRRLDDPRTYTLDSPVTALAAGPDGALWATRAGGATRIVPGGTPTAVAGIDPAAQGLAIAAGPDARMWVTLDRAPYLVKIAVPPRVDAGSIAVNDSHVTVTVNPNGTATTAKAEELAGNGTWQPLAAADAGSGTSPAAVTLELAGPSPRASIACG